MTPNHNWSFAPFNEDQNQQLFNYHHAAPEAAASSSSQPYPNFTNLTQEVYQSTISSDTAQLALISQEAGRYYHTESESLSLGHEREVNIYTSHGGSCDHRSAPLKNENRNVSRISVSSKREGKQEKKGKNVSVKWMSSKMRLMRKTMSLDQAATDIPERSTHNDRSSQDSPNGSSNTVRVCADCNTTKTPLWRSGPRGPKSLCNACGIRQRKARRAAMAAAGANGTLVAANNTPTKKKEAQYKEGKIKLNSHLPFKKRCKFTAQDGSSKKPCFEDLTLVLKNNSSAFQRVFPQDEKEAAILLMALSYGLVHG
uniref:GATA-type domain-containing protein n=1 Tax=Rhizophora mucronata TaxID=61149 RepID=A0A2P2JSF8_RHIMU